MMIALNLRISTFSEQIIERVQGYREHLHQYPELSFQEYDTMKFVCQVLSELGIEHTKGIAGTGVVAMIRGSSEQKRCIALRADMDALPIQEETTVAYKSKKSGIMHACGHDVHTSVLLGAAAVINQFRSELSCDVKLIFQPGEEKNPGGASIMIAEGVLNSPRVDEIYALHVFPDLQVGHVGMKSGIYMASGDEIHITINGKGGHGALPHQCVNPVMIGASILTQLQAVVTQQCDPKIPSVLTFGYFNAQAAPNTIPNTAKLKGTFRTMDEDWRRKAHVLIKEGAEQIAIAHGGSAEVELSVGYPFLENDEKLIDSVRRKAMILLGEDKVHELPIRLTSEDFSFYAQQIPAAFFRLGVQNEEEGIIHGLHHPKFNIDHRALLTGVKMMSAIPFDI
jgi:amidohydrolase